MKLQSLPTKTAFAAMRKTFHSAASARFFNCPLGVSNVRWSGEELMSKLLERKWTLTSPDTNIHQILISAMRGKQGGEPFGNVSFTNNTAPCLGDDMIVNDQDRCFYVVRDDLLHPLINEFLPCWVKSAIWWVLLQITGLCIIAAVSCAERGLNSHLLLRGEQPEILTGYNLISTIYGNVTYVPRSLYAHRTEMLTKHAKLVAGSNGYILRCNEIFDNFFTTQISGASTFAQMNAHSGAIDRPRKVVIFNEGAGNAVALLGIFRLVQYLSQDHLLGKKRAVKFVVDAGTGTTAVGLGLGAICFGLPWEVTAVMLADKIEGYRQHEKNLISEFMGLFGFLLTNKKLNEADCGIVNWVERYRPRRFGNVLEGEIKTCQQIAQLTGILVDPVYTLAAWQMATLLSDKELKGDANVVMLHTGGTLDMFGLAQRYKSDFHSLKGGIPDLK